MQRRTAARHIDINKQISKLKSLIVSSLIAMPAIPFGVYGASERDVILPRLLRATIAKP